MIIMNLEVDNLYCFEDFKINFSYPKKIVNSTVEYEYLKERPNFRFKRVNIIMGANASGKTLLGKCLKNILDFINNRNSSNLMDSVIGGRVGSFSVELAVEEEENIFNLYEVYCVISNYEVIELEIKKAIILKNDSYEKVKEKLQQIYPYNSFHVKKENINEESYITYLNRLSKVFSKGLFVFPEEIDKSIKIELKNEKVLEKILKTFDTAIREVIKSEEVANLYHIIFKNGKTLSIQSGVPMEKNFLSTGTEKAIFISHIIEEMLAKNGTFYVDEQFSYVQSELEVALLSLMITILKPKSQLFFTTHNIDVLEMDIPIHSYVFMKKDDKIEVISPSDFIKKNDRSLLNAVRNDVFSTLPNTDLLNEILESDENE